MTNKVADGILEKLNRNSDLKAEFHQWLKTRDFPENGIEVEGINAKALSETTHLSPIGVYTFLIYLREKPEEALVKLKKGLPTK